MDGVLVDTMSYHAQSVNRQITSKLLINSTHSPVLLEVVFIPHMDTYKIYETQC